MGGISVCTKDNCFVNSSIDEEEKGKRSNLEKGNVLDISEKIAQVQLEEGSFDKELPKKRKFIESFNEHYISNSVKDLPILSDQISIGTIEQTN